MNEGSLYAHPRAYDIAYSYRDYAREIAALSQWYMVSTGSSGPPDSVLELACGPGRHAIEFSTNAIRGAGLDLSQDMCDYAESLTEEAGTTVRFEQADMTDFDLGERFDLVILMLNSLHYILDEQALCSHFRSVGRHLSDAGVYIVEADLCIKRPGRDSPVPPPEIQEKHDSTVFDWSAERDRDGIQIRMEYPRDRNLEIASLSGTVAGVEFSVEERIPTRCWTLNELLAAAGSEGLTLSAHFGNVAVDGIESLTLSDGGDLHPCTCWQREG